MKKMKRLLSLALAFCLAFALAVPAAAEEEAEMLELNWNEEYTGASVDVTVPAGGLNYYCSYMLAGMELTVQHKDAYVVYNGNTYYAKNGKVTVAIPAAMGRVYTEIAIGNSGSSSATFTVNVMSPLGTAGNPQILSDEELSGGFSAVLAENDDNGYEFRWTASASGYLIVSATSDNGACDVSIQATYAKRQMWTTDAKGKEVCSNPAVIWVEKGEVIGINLSAKCDKSYHYAAMKVDAVGMLVSGNVNDPIPVASPTFVAEVGAGKTVHYSGYMPYMTISVTGEDLANVSVSYGNKTYTDTDGDNVIYVDIGRVMGGFGSSSTVSITNNGEFTGYYTVVIPIGVEANPDALVLGKNEVDLSGEYYYSWTAQEDGELTLAIDTDRCSDWYYAYDVYSKDGEYIKGDYSESEASDSAPTATVSVKKGDVVKVILNSSSRNPAKVVMKASFAVPQEDPCANGHSYGDWNVSKAPTCAEEGEEERICVNCENRETKAVPATGEHNWDAGVVTTEPTEESEGVRTYTCGTCGATKTEAIAKLEHVHAYSAEATLPTCTEQGFTTYVCACGDSYVDNYTEATGHFFGAWYTVTEPTEETEGVEQCDCTVCGHSETRAIAKLDHVHAYTESVTAPTCTEQGYTTHTCACGDSYVDDYTPATGEHTWGDWIVYSPGTCESDGWQYRECENCGEKDGEAIPATGTHDWDEGVVTTEPTENGEGVRTYTCGACGETKTESIPALQHNHEYDDEGLCTVCGKLSLSHRFIDVPENAWYYSYADFVVERGLMNGTGSDTFAPTTVINRASVAVLLWNMAGKPGNSVTENPFNDVKENFWYTDAIFWAYESGVVSGNGAGGFNPNNDVTREQLAVMLYKFAETMGYELTAIKDVDLATFPDGSSVSGWAASYVKWAVDLGLINGKANGGQNFLAPKDTATRAEIAVIFTNFVKLVEGI